VTYDAPMRRHRELALNRPISRRGFLESSVLGAGALLGAGSPVFSTKSALAAALLPQTLHQKVAQLFIISFQGLSASHEILSLLDRYMFGGVVLYADNCHSATQIRTMLAELQAVARYPLLVCTDQEGGRVVRIRDGAPSFPWEATYGVLGSTDRVYQDAAMTARDLRGLGLTMNLAPVVDVLSNHTSPIGRRSYGSDPNLTARLSTAAIRGYQQHGMASTAKHFVGLGHTSIDSHRALPTVTLTLAQLEARDFIPFRAAIAAGVSSVMVAHVALPSVDSVYRPASLSPVVIEGVLRTRLGFKGVVMTDSLIMGALPKGHEAEAAERAFAAGADILLIGGKNHIPSALIEESVERVVAAISTGRIPQSRLDTALGRVLALKRRYAPAVLPIQ
jgi:beta-N-acetylhexosaminidase